MRDIGIKAIYSKPRTTVRNKKSIDYNILANTDITRPNQAWQTDITYLRTKHGFMYLVAIIDSFTRSILSWRLSNSLSIDASLFCLTDTLSFYKKPDLLHSDQGSQFTSEIWSDRLKKHKIAISLSGRGKSNDNAKVERLWRTMKYEYIYLYGINNATNLKRGINDFVNWYNRDRPHQALGYKTPDELMKEYIQVTMMLNYQIYNCFYLNNSLLF